MRARPAARIEIHIDELVLDGFGSGDRHRIGEAVEHELNRVLSQRGAGWPDARTSTVTRVDGGSFTMPATGHPNAVGREIGGAVGKAVAGVVNGKFQRGR